MPSFNYIRIGTLAILASSWTGLAVAQSTLTPELLQRSLSQPGLSQCSTLAALRSQDTGTALQLFYQRNAFVPLWQDQDQLQALQQQLRELADDGLVTSDYSFALNARSVEDPCTELQISSEYLLALEHLSSGRLSPPEVETPWIAEPERNLSVPDPVSIAASGLQNPAVAFGNARPSFGPYRALRQAYVALDRQQPAPPAFPAGPLLKPGMQDERVVQLSARLASENYLAAAAAAAPQQRDYDETLQDAVRRFQADHGLETDAIVGPITIAALNVTPAQRLQQVRINLERLRWLNALRRDYLLLVNIAAGDIRLLRGEQPLWQAKAMTGRPSRPTPLLVSRIDRITLNPSWTIPPTIMREDALPQIRRGTDYLERNQLLVLDREGRQLDPAQVDWSRAGGLILRQPPGPTNPLGRLVFRFANPMAVFLHDTPSQPLFARAARNVSSGCVRVEQAGALADLLWGGLPAKERARLAELQESGQTHEIALADGPQLILAYWTAEVRSDGRLVLLPDPYRRDAALLAAFARLDGGAELAAADPLPGTTVGCDV